MWGKGNKSAKFYLLPDRIGQKKLEKANAYSKPRGGKTQGVWVRSLGAAPSFNTRVPNLAQFAKDTDSKIQDSPV